ncbi:MAG: Mur ligase family protein [Bacillota bacterium]|jgi:UDP-N-acetylmuramoyl-tripeptide--D-alanyl-D-alanine ligase
MFELIFYIAVFAVWFGYLLRRLVQQLHMMQQNSYRTERFMRWLKPRMKEYLLKRDMLTFFLLLAAALVFDGLAVPAIALVLFGGLNLSWHRPPEKKALAFTKRAKRLYACDLIITAVFGTAAAVLITLRYDWAVALLAVVALCCPFVQWLAAGIMKPVENHINNGFIEDAKRIIKEMPALTTVGITGSYGKTSSKFILGRILSESKHTLVTPDSYNTPMGITITVRNSLKPIHEVFVAEMGARQKGDIKELCDLVQPKIGILTAIGPQHLETFGNIETVAATKFELIDSLPADGLAVLNQDDEQIRKNMSKVKVRTLTYAIENIGEGENRVDYWAENIGFSAQGMSFILKSKAGASVPLRTQLLGKHNIYNILAAAAVAVDLGMDYNAVSRAVAAVPPVPHRLVLKRAGNFTIIDDAFNSNPVGSAMALEVLSKMPGGRKIIITPGMVELGAEEYNKNKAFAVKCAELCDYVIIVGKKHSGALVDGIKETGLAEDKYYIAESLADANGKMRSMVRAGDYVLFENDLPDTYL